MTSQMLAVRIVPMVRSRCGLDLGYYSSVVKLNDLTHELFTLYEYLKVEEVRPMVEKVLELWQRHYETLKPLLECGVNNVRKLITDAQFRKKIFARLLLSSASIQAALQLLLAIVFVYQCTELWSIRSAIKEAVEYVNDDEVRLEFAKVEFNVQQLKEISAEVDQLVKEYEVSTNPRETTLLLKLINAKLKSVHQYQDTSQLIANLQLKLSTQQNLLAQCDQRFLKTGLNSLSASGIGLLTVLIRDKLADIEQSLSHLSEDCEIEFNCTMEQIGQIEERKEELEAKRLLELEATPSSGVVASLRKAAGGWRLLASSYMGVLQ